jgi:hypothetical protein
MKPTIIRSWVNPETNTLFVVISVWGDPLTVVAQEYQIHPGGDRTILIRESVWGSEEGAIQTFDRWVEEAET